MLWGGILEAKLFGGFYVRWAKLGFWRMAELVAPAIALGIGLGRIGCFLINDHLGAPTNLPWGILWPDGISRHPVAMYESLVGFGLFAILMIIQKKLSLRAQLRSSAAARSNPEILPPSAGSPRPAEAGLAMTKGNLFLLFLIS